MGALLELLNVRKTLIFISAITAILVFLATQETASATVPMPSLNFDLARNQNNPRGLWGDGNTLWIVENDGAGNEQVIGTFNLNNGARRGPGEFHLTNHNIVMQGIWSDGSTMWIADWDDKKLYAYLLNKKKLNNTERIPEKDISLAGSNDHPRGVWGTFGRIFVVDKDDTKVYAYSTNDGSRLTEEEFDLDAANGNPWGIWGSETWVWISDIDDNMLYVYERNPNSSEHGERKLAFEIRLPQGNDDPRGIWSDGQTMWVADDQDDAIYAMHFRNFRHTSDELDINQVDTPTGLWTDGRTMWVADAGRSDYGKLFAYNLNNGNRRPGKDVQLADFNLEPLSMWSDGTNVWALEDSTGNDFLYAYAMEPASDEVGQLVPYKSIFLDSDNSDPRGTWSNGDTIWVSDSGDDKLYAYDLDDRSRDSGLEFDLHSDNDDPGEIWSDGEIVWVMDAEDKGAYAYELATGTRLEHKDFLTAPDNDNPTGGLTGHELRLWVADSDDEMLYAYGRLNASPTFTETSASFKIHRTVSAGDYVGTVPEAVDPDGESVTYMLTSGGLGVFQHNSQTGEIFLRDDFTGFSGGEEYTLTVAVTDGQSPLDGLSSDADDAINVTITVIQNADAEFTTEDAAVFTVSENLAEEAVIAQLETTDLDGDTLSYEMTPATGHPFQLDGEQIELASGESLDYEGTDSYGLTLRVRDGKDEDGNADLSWDDEITVTIDVTNVDEAGAITLDSAHPQVNTEIGATLTDPDGVDFSNGNQVSWVVERSSDASDWSQVSQTNTSSASYGYTPVTADTDMYLRFTATYRDGYDTVNAKSVEFETANKVLSEPPTNRPPTFDEDAPGSLSIIEDTAPGTNIGLPIPATDPESDTLTFDIVVTSVNLLDITPGGQLSLKADAVLNYEGLREFYVWIRVRDSKDPYGVADTQWDATHQVKVLVTNADEAGWVTLSSENPEVGAQLAARVLDLDRLVRNVTWQWQTAASAESTSWTNISDATSGTYTPVPGDTGKFLRAMANYDDGEGTGKEASGTSANAVVRPDNAPPTFDEGTSAVRSINENSEAGTRVGAVVAATDPDDDDALTYSLASGMDSGLFSIDSTTGRLEVDTGAVLDFETDAELEVELQVSDGKAADHSQDDSVDATMTLTINLLNVDEPGSVTLSLTEPEVGVSITATLTDPDGAVSDTAWQWEESEDGVNDWTAIAEATMEDYAPATGDAGKYLRAVVEYTDGEGSGKSANGMTASAVDSPPADTSLASLTLGNLSFSFSSSTLEYSLTAPAGTEGITVTSTPTASSGVTVEISPADSEPGTDGHQVELQDETRITITVSENQGRGSTTYTIQITREDSEQQDPQQQDPLQQDPPQQDPPQQDPPQQDPPQQDPPAELSQEENCRNDEREGLIAHCGIYPFAMVRVEFDGSYTIDWSEWDSDHPDVTGYSVLIGQFMYRMYKDENGSIHNHDRLSQIYESCEFVGGKWDCQGSLAFIDDWVDWDGNPTEVLEFATNEDLTEWSYAMEEPGRHAAERTFYQWSGDATDPDNEPEAIVLQTQKFEMDLYHIHIYEGNNQVGKETIMVHGADGFD